MKSPNPTVPGRNAARAFALPLYTDLEERYTLHTDLEEEGEREKRIEKRENRYLEEEKKKKKKK